MAKLETQKITTKTGRNLILKSASSKDAQRTIDYLCHIFAEKKFMVTLPEEFKQSLAEQEERLSKTEESPCDIAILIEDQEKIVGYLHFTGNKRKRLAHVGSFGMSVHQDCRNEGVGKALIQALIEWVKKDTKIEKIGLSVFANNENAMRLYKKFGFKEEGRKVKEIMLEDGTYIDDILMYITVNRSSVLS